MVADARMPRTGAAKSVVPKYLIGIAFWIAGVPGRAVIVKVKAPSAIAGGISRCGTPACRNNASATGNTAKATTKRLITAVGEDGTRQHHRHDRTRLAQPLGYACGRWKAPRRCHP